MELRHWKKLFGGVDFCSLFGGLRDFHSHLFSLLTSIDGLMVKLHGSNRVSKFFVSTLYFDLAPNLESLIQLNHRHAKSVVPMHHFTDGIVLWHGMNTTQLIQFCNCALPWTTLELLGNKFTQNESRPPRRRPVGNFLSAAAGSTGRRRPAGPPPSFCPRDP